MAGEMRRIEFMATTYDIEHWPAGALAAAEAAGDGYHDWAFAALEEAMRTAGQQWIDQHRDLFACDLT